MKHRFLGAATRVYPILTAQTSESIIKEGDAFYYVTPWVEGIPFSDQEKRKLLLEHLARLHDSTVELEPMEAPQKIDQAADVITQRWRAHEEWLTAFIERAEHTTYPSPFEQLVLAYYHSLVQETETAIRALEKWKETAKEVSMHRRVLCHGRPSIEHFICDPYGGMFISIEDATMDSPCLDLAALFESPTEIQGPLIHELDLYEQIFELRENEKDLLIAFLHFPSSVYRLIMRYERYPKRGQELKFIEAFEAFHLYQPTRYDLIKALETRNDEEAGEEE
nr:phosphotransferase [Pullulanibacillus pueri]